MKKYTIDDLTAELGISRWTIYDLRKRRVIPKPYGGRRNAFYGEEHRQILLDYVSKAQARKALVKPRLPTSPLRKSLSNATRAKVWELCEGRCSYCGTALNPFLNFHIDHVIPVIRGGTDSLENLVGSCSACNLTKGSKDNWLFDC